MDKNVSILIYEKEKDLNSILYQQISDTINYKVYTANDQKMLIELINKKKIDIFVVNIEVFESPQHQQELISLLKSPSLI